MLRFARSPAKTGMQKSRVCPICDSNSIRAYISAPEELLQPSSLGSARSAVSHGTILRCQACGFGFIESRLTDAQLAKLYSELDHQIYEAEEEGRARTARTHLGIVLDVAASGTLLDVGCASGYFLRSCAENGFKVVGVEPAKEFAARARAILEGKGEVFCATLQDAPLQDSFFDVVTLWDVLEHVAEPVDFLCKCGSLLKSGGWLFANVPDLASLQAVILGRRWPLLLPEHLNYFTRTSLELCARKAGFELLRFGRRPAFFSVGYILRRLAQHHIPGTNLAKLVATKLRLNRVIAPVPLGETYGVWKKR
jgi:SAM-dependent methyltransferase